MQRGIGVGMGGMHVNDGNYNMSDIQGINGIDDDANDADEYTCDSNNIMYQMALVIIVIMMNGFEN